jgi:hypothetical protein
MVTKQLTVLPQNSLKSQRSKFGCQGRCCNGKETILHADGERGDDGNDEQPWRKLAAENWEIGKGTGHSAFRSPSKRRSWGEDFAKP